MTPEGRKAFEELKRMLCSAPVLRSPDLGQPFYIHCDASKTGVGGVLVQRTSKGDEYPIAFVSKKLNKAQRNYSVTEQECLAAIVCINRFRGYVEEHEFTVITDHALLKWLMSQTDLNSRLARWVLKHQGFNFKIEHRSGRLNVVPDALSRVNEEDLAAVGDKHGFSIDLESPAFKSAEYVAMANQIEANKDSLADLKVDEGRLYEICKHAKGDPLHDTFIRKLWLPQDLIPKVMAGAHDDPLASHGGIHKTLEQIRRYWLSLVKYVKEHVLARDVCKATKAPNCVQLPPMGAAPESQRFFQRLYVDFLGPYPRSRSGHVGIFIVLDRNSKFVFLKAVTKLTADVVIKYLQQELFAYFWHSGNDDFGQWIPI